MKRLERQDYLNWLIQHKDKQIIKVVTGVRRCGKSTIFEIYRDYLLSQGILPGQIIALNFEDLDYEELTDYRALYQYCLLYTSRLHVNFIHILFTNRSENLYTYNMISSSFPHIL